ncbi:MAG TPA: alpha/beta fold hydrolase [Steroidobacteraceae bacterium]|nr:alpha/beta fold hydrolase [Steroidobacteraceae bacterium]
MRTLRVLLAAAASFALGACFSDGTSSGDGGIGPTDPTSGNGNPGSGGAGSGFRALFVPLGGILPYPNDLYFSGSTDGTLNLPATPFNPNIASVNALDGYSTSATLTARFSAPIDPTSLNGASVRMIQVHIDNATKATTGVTAPLTYGVDYTASVSTEIGSNSSTLEIVPLKPLVPSTGGTNNGYLVVLTDGIRDTGGHAAVSDSDYASIKAAQPTCATITNTSLNGICRLTGAHLAIAGAFGVTPDHVAVTFSFSTQSIRDTMLAVAGTVAASPAQPIGVAPAGFNTGQLGLPGHADIYFGTVSVPYYLTVAADNHSTLPLTRFWQAAGASPAPGIDPASRNLTRFNPVPGATVASLAIPLLVTAPNANATAGAARPANGWPVAIFQHGITGDRSNMLAIADAFADAGFVVVAIDLPLHGITSAASPLYQPTHERTFNLDLTNNTTGASGPDGVIDSSGSFFINLTSPLTSRDNLRQAAADLLSLTKSLSTLDLTGDAVPDIDMTSVHFVGHSLGGIVGGVYSGVATTIKTATLAMPGGKLANLLIDSPTFGPRINAALAASGLHPNTTLYNQFMRDVQDSVDSGDPFNFIAAAAAAHPMHMIQVVGPPPDSVVPNNATQRLILAANLTKASTTTVNAAGIRAYVNFTTGNHSSILSPAGGLPVTVEMQTETVLFAYSNGTQLVISNPAVIQP